MLLTNERKSWSHDHNVRFDEHQRIASLKILRDIREGTQVHIAYKNEAILLGIGSYQHWFIVVGDNSEYFIEFGSADLNHENARVNINNSPREHEKVKEATMNKVIRQRIEHVLGMKNYSLCLRNCEHVANYIFKGIWYSKQMENWATILEFFMHDKAKFINKFPSKIRPHVFIESENREQVYSFISNEEIELFEPYSMQYFLDEPANDTYNILLIGPTGSGKSNLVNVIFNRKIVESEPGFDPVTDEIVMIKCKGKIYNNETNSYISKDIIVTDTIGLSDRNWENNPSLDLFTFLKEHISCNFRKFDVVYIVFRNDRLLQDSINNIKNVLNWLDYENHLNRIRFIITKSDRLNDDAKYKLKNEAIGILDIKRNNVVNLIPSDEYLIYFTGFAPELVDGVENLSDIRKEQIKEDLSKLIKNMKHSNVNDRIEINLFAQNNRCTIL